LRGVFKTKCDEGVGIDSALPGKASSAVGKVSFLPHPNIAISFSVRVQKKIYFS
jgi:hypothetical protein